VSCPAVNVGQQFVHRNRLQIQSSILALPKAAIVSPSNWLANEAQNSYLKGSDIPITVIPNVLDPNFYRDPTKQKFSSNEIVLTFVAADIGSGYKGLSMLLEALTGFGEANKTKMIRLNIIGGGAIDIPKNIGVNIALLGSLDSSDLMKILAMTDLCVVPSLYDNSPSSIIEAQLLQVPVLATRTGGIPDLIEDGVTGYLCDATSSSLLDGLIRALADTERREIGLRGREAALLRHDPSNIVSRYDEVYKGLLHG
jgi:glycosyltransferase involved in cell wall biosynthesis